MQQDKVFVFFGLIASGKSTLAKAWSVRHSLTYYNSDVIRKELAANMAADHRKAAFAKGIYSKEFTEKTYLALLERAEDDLAHGKSVVLDASYQSCRERERVRECAERLKARPFFILCTCPEEEMQRRMERRARDPKAISDGRWEIYVEQKKRFEAPDELGADEFVVFETIAPVEVLVDRLDTIVQHSITIKE